MSTETDFYIENNSSRIRRERLTDGIGPMLIAGLIVVLILVVTMNKHESRLRTNQGSFYMQVLPAMRYRQDPRIQPQDSRPKWQQGDRTHVARYNSELQS